MFFGMRSNKKNKTIKKKTIKKKTIKRKTIKKEVEKSEKKVYDTKIDKKNRPKLIIHQIYGVFRDNKPITDFTKYSIDEFLNSDTTL